MIEQDAETRAQILQIQRMLLEIKEEIKSLKSPIKTDDWLQAAAFCRKFNICYATLQSHVKKGLIESKDFGEKYLRYRWVEQ